MKLSLFITFLSIGSAMAAPALQELEVDSSELVASASCGASCSCKAGERRCYCMQCTYRPTMCMMVGPFGKC